MWVAVINSGISNWVCMNVYNYIYQQYSKCNKVQCPQLQWLLTILPLVQKSAVVSRQLLSAIKLCCHCHHGKYAIASFSACICNRYISSMNIGHLVLSEAHTLDIYLVIPTVTLWNLCYKIWHTKLTHSPVSIPKHTH